MNTDQQKELDRLDAAIILLEQLNWVSLGNWIFFKSGKIYDLSAADLSQLERIEREGLFIPTAKMVTPV